MASRLFDTLESAPGWSKTVSAVDRLYVWHFRRTARSKNNNNPLFADYRHRSGVVLIVCKGNICRSPFLAHYLRGMCADKSITFESAGFRAKKDAVSPPAAIESAAELGVDLGTHRARPLRDKDVESADLIVGMEPIHHLEFCLRYSQWRRKFVLLRTLEATPGSLKLPDPFGCDTSAFQQCYQLLARDGERLLAVLQTARKGKFF